MLRFEKHLRLVSEESAQAFLWPNWKRIHIRDHNPCIKVLFIYLPSAVLSSLLNAGWVVAVSWLLTDVDSLVAEHGL